MGILSRIRNSFRNQHTRRRMRWKAETQRIKRGETDDWKAKYLLTRHYISSDWSRIMAFIIDGMGRRDARQIEWASVRRLQNLNSPDISSALRVKRKSKRGVALSVGCACNLDFYVFYRRRHRGNRWITRIEKPPGGFHESLDNLSIKTCVEYESQFRRAWFASTVGGAASD